VAGGNAQLVRAAGTPQTDDETYTTPGNYIFDANKIEIAAGQAQLLATAVARQHDELYNTPANYTIPEPTKLEVDGGEAKLKIVNTAGQFGEGFDSSTGFTFDAAKVEFAQSQVRHLINSLIADETFYASYNTDEDADRSDGDDTGTLQGSAVVSGGKLDTVSATGYCSYLGTSNLSTGFNIGAMRCLFTPNYTGSPASDRTIMSWSEALSDIDNRMSVTHMSNGDLRFEANKSTGQSIYSESLAFSPTSGVQVEFEWNWDYVTKTYEFFIDGVKVKTWTNSGGTSRTNSIDRLNVGAEHDGTVFADGKFDDVQFFDAVQHTANYTPASAPSDSFAESNVTLPQFILPSPSVGIDYTGFIVGDVNTPRYNISLDNGSTFLYWNGSAWVVSDDTYAQHTPKPDFLANIAALSAVDNPIIQISFPAGEVLMAVSQLDLFFTTQNFPIDNPIITPVVGLDASGFEAGVDTWDAIAFTETKPGSDDVRYIISDDDGTTFLFWNGSVWAASDLTFAQAVPSSDVVTNIGAFPTTSSKFLIRAFLHSDDGLTTPDLGNIQLNFTTIATMPLDNPPITPNASIDASIEGGVDAWSTFVESATKPANTEIQYILSFDAGTTWYFWNGSAWVISDETFTQSNLASVVNTNFAAFFTTNSQILIRAFLSTTSLMATPQLNNVQWVCLRVKISGL